MDFEAFLMKVWKIRIGTLGHNHDSYVQPFLLHDGATIKMHLYDKILFYDASQC